MENMKKNKEIDMDQNQEKKETELQTAEPAEKNPAETRPPTKTSGPSSRT